MGHLRAWGFALGRLGVLNRSNPLTFRFFRKEGDFPRSLDSRVYLMPALSSKRRVDLSFVLMNLRVANTLNPAVAWF